MLRNMAASLLRHETIRTTVPKAKELRRVVEPLITLGKSDSDANRRRAFARLRDTEMVEKLFDDLGPRFKTRPGGYTRILHMATAPGRFGADGADAAGRVGGRRPRPRRTRARRSRARARRRPRRPRRRPRKRLRRRRLRSRPRRSRARHARRRPLPPDAQQRSSCGLPAAAPGHRTGLSGAASKAATWARIAACRFSSSSTSCA